MATLRDLQKIKSNTASGAIEQTLNFLVENNISTEDVLNLLGTDSDRSEGRIKPFDVKVDEDASDVATDCTPTAVSITDTGGDSTHYATFNLGATIVAITALTADGDGSNIAIMLSEDADVHDNILVTDVPVGATIYGKWTGTFSLYEGNSVMIYTQGLTT